MRHLTAPAVLCLAAVLSTRSAAAQGLTVFSVSPSRNGTASAWLELSSPELVNSIRQGTAPSLIPVVGHGQARVSDQQAFVSLHETLVSVLAFDTSASFQPHLRNAVSLAKTFVANRPPSLTEKFSVMSFGVRSSTRDTGTLAETQAALDALEKQPLQAATRLKSSISDALQLASDRQPMPLGLRQVLLFTDAGEESSAYTMADLVRQAQARGVRVHVLVFPNPTHKGARFAQYRDELRLLAESTGGRDLSVTSPNTDTAAMVGLAKAVENVYRLTLQFCGVPAQSAFLDDALTVESQAPGPRLLRSNSFPFSQQAAGSAILSCSPKPATTCSAAPCPSASAVAASTSSPPATPTDSTKLLRLFLSSALLFLLTLGGLFYWTLRSRRRPLQAQPSPLALREPSAPTQTQPSAPSQPLNPFSVLPNLEVVVLQGLAAVPAYHLTKPIVHMGAAATMDMVLDHEMVSGHHAVLELLADGSISLKDMGSRNGTYLDGNRIPSDRPCLIYPGQRIGISRFVELTIQPRRPAPASITAQQADVLQVPSAVNGSPIASSPNQKAKTVVDIPEWKSRS